MNNLIACLSFNPNNNDAILPILESRLQEVIKLCREQPEAELVLMGGATFRAESTGDLSLAMKQYLETQAPDVLDHRKVHLTNEGTSTVRELSMLREMTNQETERPKVTIVASEFFVDRVKLYTEYIFGDLNRIEFVASRVPDEGREGLQEIEETKFVKGQEWLAEHEKGDYQRILREQEIFEGQVRRGEIEHPVSRPVKLR